MSDLFLIAGIFILAVLNFYQFWIRIKNMEEKHARQSE